MMDKSQGQIVILDPKGQSQDLLVLNPGIRNPTKHRFISIQKYRPDMSVDIALGRFLPHLRGTWIPSFDVQADYGLAVNWAGIRVRVSGAKIWLKN